MSNRSSGRCDPYDSDTVRAYTTRINEALERCEPLNAQGIIGELARKQGMSQIAASAGISRENLYRAVSGKREAYFSTIVKTLDSLGYVLRIEEKPTPTDE